MAGKKNYYIRVGHELIVVSDEVYIEYHRMKNHEQYLERKDKLKGKVLYSDMDTLETTGEDMIPDLKTDLLEDIIADKLMAEQLHRCIAMLDKQEQDLINTLFFQNLSEREYAVKIGISQKGVNKRRQKVLKKLKVLLEKN